MGSWAPRRQPPSAAVLRGAIGLAAIATLTACSTTGGAVKLPPKNSAAAVPAASASPAGFTAGSPQQQAVADTYLAFWSASSRAEKTGNATSARAILAPYTYPNYINTMITGMRSAWLKHEVIWGAAVEHIESVHVAPLKQGQYVATVRDCQDSSHQGFANATTGALVGGSLGAPHQQLYTSLGFVSGHWLVEQVTFLGNTCTS